MTDEERHALTVYIEEGYQQAERGELTGAAEARSETQKLKDNWRKGRSPREVSDYLLGRVVKQRPQR